MREPWENTAVMGSYMDCIFMGEWLGRYLDASIHVLRSGASKMMLCLSTLFAMASVNMTIGVDQAK